MLTFEPRGHIYRWSGRRLVTVTEVLRWAGYYDYLKYAKQSDLNRARTLGIGVHEQVDRNASNGFEPAFVRQDAPTALARCMEQWARAVEHLQLEIVDTELRLVCPDRIVAGTLDVLARQHGEWVLVDLKVMEKVQHKAVALQTAKYQEMAEHQLRLRHGIARRFAVQITPRAYRKHELDSPLDIHQYNKHLADYLAAA